MAKTLRGNRHGSRKGRLKEVQPPIIVNTFARTPEAILAEKLFSEVDLEQRLGAREATGVF
ncbi:MAG: hypothetical protein ACU0A6_09660 [Shimia sp.]|uniref:hypothetical protein n=1 Tax=Shimia sp. TaxID=1954381 RepID=UPI004059F6AF